ncbi:hypothetical protein CLG85_021135 [Yangia mangrovi]|uniref:LysR substrate-binding domain-containing protein n=1 Tax=Alloyangia mangrovi TaxID=1779329 RepID=A0ABT2KTH0_9RHOB|nr:LysR substrate-binding domain-containing protein [Alloyangia mangrovi]MCT4372672.1 hypothetical protein [Alloyangia mangrovi]
MARNSSSPTAPPRAPSTSWTGGARLGHRFEPRLEIDTSISAVGFVQAGLGIAVVDSLLPWEQFDGIEIRPLDGAPALPLSLLTLRGKSLSRAEGLMRAQIRSLLPEGLSRP